MRKEKKEPLQMINPRGEKIPRIISQNSVFIYPKEGFIPKGEYKCTCISIKAEEKEDLLKYLKKNFDIHRRTIYNDIEGFIENMENYSSPYIEFFRGLTYQNEGEHKETIYHYDKAKDDYKKAIEHYGKAIKLNPKFAEAYNNRGTAKYYLKKYEKAIKDYTEAINLNSDHAEEAYCNRGIAKAKSDSKDYAGAIEDFDKAIELNPNLAEAYYNRSKAKYYLKNYPEALKDFNKVIEIKPKLSKSEEGQELIKNIEEAMRKQNNQ